MAWRRVLHPTGLARALAPGLVATALALTGQGAESASGVRETPRELPALPADTRSGPDRAKDDPAEPGPPRASDARPIKFSETPIRDHRAPPLLGQHTASVLAERLGYDQATINKLAARNVIGVHKIPAR